MLIGLNFITRLVKEAYKGVGLRIANTGEGYMLSGRAWAMFGYHGDLPKELLGEIMKLIGEFPEDREQYLCSRDNGGQSELYLSEGWQDVYRRATEAQADNNDAWETDILITDDYNKPYRVFRTKAFPEEEADDDAIDGSRGVYAVPAGISGAISAEYCNKNEEFYGCFLGNVGWLYWISADMAFGYNTDFTNDTIRERAGDLMQKGAV